MTKKVLAITLAVIATLALAGSASAQSLSLPIAKKLAQRLAQKQLKSRSIVTYHIQRGRRLGSERIAFRYDDRSASNQYCTARIVVSVRTPPGTKAMARFTTRACQRIPADVLAFEATTLGTSTAVNAQRPAVKASIEAYSNSFKPCGNLTVPRASRPSVLALVSAGVLAALENPVDAQVADFAQALGRIPTADATLRPAALAWADYVQGVRALPRQGTTCNAIQMWASKGYAASAAPVDLPAFTALGLRLDNDSRAILKAGRLLARSGVAPRAAVAFTTEGLLFQLRPKTAITGGTGA